MVSIQEIWLPANRSAYDLWHAIAHCAPARSTPEFAALLHFVHDRGMHAAHDPVSIIDDKTLVICAYHHGAEYKLYVAGAPERVLEHCLLSENEREKALLESRRIDTKAVSPCHIISIATGLSNQLPTSAKNARQLTLCGHIALTGPF